MTPDGRYVAFTSAASDLIANDTNGIPDVFVCDVRGDSTVLVSQGALPASATGDETSDSPAITPAGRYVAFYSSATNLIPGQTLAGDVYLRDLVAGTITWISAQARSHYEAVTGATNAVSCDPCISDDGNYVALLTCANSFVAYRTEGIVSRYHLSSGQTDLIDTNGYVPDASFESVHELDMTPDGRFVAYVDDVGNTTVTNTAIFLWDAQSAVPTPVSVDTNNALPTAFCDVPCVSSNGQYVAFLSTACLTTNASGTAWHVYRRDVSGGSTFLVDGDTNGLGSGDGPISDLALSDDGQWVAFDSSLPTLTQNDRNSAYDVFLCNVGDGSTELVSTAHPLLPSATAEGLSSLSAQALSQDGHYLAFTSSAHDLVPGDTNQVREVFVRDLYQGTTVPASVGLNGAGASGNSFEPAMSGNGQFVAFASQSTNLVAGYTNVSSAEIYVRDLQANLTYLVSVNKAGSGGGNSDSELPAIGFGGNDARRAKRWCLRAWPAIWRSETSIKTAMFSAMLFYMRRSAMAIPIMSRSTGQPPRDRPSPCNTRMI